MAKRIGDILKEKGLVTDKQLDIAFAHQKITGGLFGNLLVDLGFISSKERAMILAEQSGLEFLDLEAYVIPAEALKLVPKNVAEKAQFIPLGTEDGRLVIGVTNPGNIHAVDIATRLTKRPPKLVLIDSDIFHDALEKAYFFLENPIASKIDKIVKDVQTSGTPSGEDIVSLVDLIILDAIRSRGTDIHITPHEYAVNVFYRIDGVLQHAYCLPKAAFPGLLSRIKILSQLDIAETRLPQDGSLTFKFLTKEYDIRVSCVPTLWGQNIVLRILAGDINLLRMEALGFDSNNLKTIKELFLKPNGIVLITGPTGSGKTTTLYAALRQIDVLERNVITVEDPIEYKLTFIRQSQVNERVGYDFASATRTFLRQDPDVVLLGEIRDMETASIAIRASITGHLVLSTLHTNDAVTAIPRLLDLGVDRFLLSSSLIGVVAQRLVRKICMYCKETYEPSMSELDYIKKYSLGVTRLVRGKGCPKCRNTGYLGRTAISEVIVINEEIEELIYQGASIAAIKNAALKNGMVPLDIDGARKVGQLLTTIEEVKRVLG